MSSDTPASSNSSDEYLDLGSGISLDGKAPEHRDSGFGQALFGPSVEDDDQDPEHKTEKTKVPETSGDGWYDKPTYVDQFSRWPMHCRLEGPFFRQFDVMEDEKALSDFIRLTFPETAPKVVVESYEKKFGEASEKWKVLVTFYKVKYRRLLDPGKK